MGRSVVVDVVYGEELQRGLAATSALPPEVRYDVEPEVSHVLTLAGDLLITPGEIAPVHRGLPLREESSLAVIRPPLFKIRPWAQCPLQLLQPPVDAGCFTT